MLTLSLHAAAWNDQVTEACTHEGRAATAEETAVCHAYIEGFLDGAIITDTAIIESVADNESAESDYFKRAYLTRVGSNSRILPPTALAHFCLPEGTERDNVVTTIATAMAEKSASGSDVSQSLYNILKASYPCED
jgi:hypothetical protein